MSTEMIPNYELMSQELRNITDEMVFEGVTPKKGMRSVKAIKKLWKSDSFEVMKSLLVEDPIREGIFRSQAKPQDDTQSLDLKSTSSNGEYDTLKNDILLAKLKLEFKKKYETALEEDLKILMNRSKEIMAMILSQTKEMFENSEKGQLEDAVKQLLQEMRTNIKLFKKQKKKQMKLAVRLNINEVMREIDEFAKRDMFIRIQIYRKLLEKVYDYRLRMLAEHCEEQVDEEINKRNRISFFKFQMAKEKLIKKLDAKYKLLQCKLEREFNEFKYPTRDQNEILNQMGVKSIKSEMKDEEKNDSGEDLIKLMVSRMKEECLLPPEIGCNEDWESIVHEMIKRYQIFIELALNQTNIKQSQYFLSLEKLRQYKEKIAQMTLQKISYSKPTINYEKFNSSLESKGETILSNIIQDIVPSRDPSRVSASDLQLFTADCQNQQDDTSQDYIYKNKISIESQKMNISYFRHSINQSENLAVINGQIDVENTQDNMGIETGISSDEKIQDFINTCRHNKRLFNLFFYSI